MSQAFSISFVTVFSLILLSPNCVITYQGGAPCATLSDLQPGPPHGSAQTTTSPYGLRVIDSNGKIISGNYRSSEIYTVEIYARCGTWTPIRGFLVVAKDKPTGSIVGQFLKDNSNYWQAVQYPCRDKNLGSVTHYSAYDRTQPVQFHWQMKNDDDHFAVSDPDVIFEATIVQSFHKYWKGIHWPDSPTANCHCKDQKEFNCAGYAKNHQCESFVVRDSCVFTCNNCSSIVNK